MLRRESSLLEKSFAANRATNRITPPPPSPRYDTTTNGVPTPYLVGLTNGVPTPYLVGLIEQLTESHHHHHRLDTTRQPTESLPHTW